MLETGDDALLARIHAFRAATRSIELQTFIWANDETGRYLMHELVQAARRGVAVRLLVDQWVETGGTMDGAIRLVERQKGIVAGIAAIAIEDNERTRAYRG